MPKEYALLQNYPNPFNMTTRIEYALPRQSHVKITVYDIAGRELVTLHDDARPAGYGVAESDGRNTSGVHVGSGVYFYRIQAGSFTQTRRMLLIR